jgi:hypothetical protein
MQKWSWRSLTHWPDLSDEHGRLLICPLPETLRQQNAEATRQWRSFVDELADDLPGRARLTCCALLPSLANGRERAAEEVLFNVREIQRAGTQHGHPPRLRTRSTNRSCA